MSDEIFFILHSEQILLLKKISVTILRLKKREQTELCKEYLLFFELGHKLLLNRLSKWYQEFSRGEGNFFVTFFQLVEFTYTIRSSMVRIFWVSHSGKEV